MRPSNEHQREVLAYLRNVYRVSNLELVARGKHPKARFEYRGAPYSVSLAGSPADWRSTNNAKANIRRLLGAPPASPPNPPRRTLAEMTPRPIAFDQAAE